MENLKGKDLESKISTMNNTVVTLKLALHEVKCEKAKQVLRLQIDTYTNSLRELLMLLGDNARN